MSFRNMELTFLLLWIVGVGIYCVYTVIKLNRKVAHLDGQVSRNYKEIDEILHAIDRNRTKNESDHFEIRTQLHAQIINEVHPGSYVVEFGNKRLFPQQLSGPLGFSQAIAQAFGKKDKTDYSYKAMLDFVKTRPELSKDNIKEVKHNAAE